MTAHVEPVVMPMDAVHPCMTCRQPSGVTYGELKTMPPVVDIICGECVNAERKLRGRDPLPNPKPRITLWAGPEAGK